MTPGEFCEKGESLFGTGWQVKLARALGRDDRTIRRWKSGESPVPKVVAEWLSLREIERKAGRVAKSDAAMKVK